MGDTDHALVLKVQRGDRNAFNLLVTRYQHRILKLISRYVRDRDEAMDVAQEAFIKAYRALPSFRGESAFYTWLYRIAINTAKNHLAALARRPAEADVTNTLKTFTLGGGDQVGADPSQAKLSLPSMQALLDALRSVRNDDGSGCGITNLAGCLPTVPTWVYWAAGGVAVVGVLWLLRPYVGLAAAVAE